MKKERENWGGIERRRYPRKDIQLEIYYSHLDDFFYDYAINLSRGGMFITTTRSLPLGTEITLRFAIPRHKEMIETKGKVVREVKPHDPSGHAQGMGIEFQELSEKDIVMINSIWEDASRKNEETPK